MSHRTVRYKEEFDKKSELYLVYFFLENIKSRLEHKRLFGGQNLETRIEGDIEEFLISQNWWESDEN